MTDTFVLPEDLADQYHKADTIIGNCEKKIYERAKYIINVIFKHAFKDKVFTPSWSLGDDEEDDTLIDLISYEYTAYTVNIYDNITFLIDTPTASSINLLGCFPSSWMYNEAFEEELVAGRERYLVKQDNRKAAYKAKKAAQKATKKDEKELIKSIKAKLTKEELAVLHKATL